MEIKQIHFPTIKKWRSWLEKNHIKQDKVAVIRYKKHTGKPSPSYQELMHEAICFGWIDTTVKGIDDEKYLINFSKRNSKSRWSDNTQSYARKLIEEGKMSPEGLKHYHSGLTRPVLGHGIPKNPDMPEELETALNKNKKAKENFSKFAPSYKRMYYRWILSAKTKETKEKRVSAIVEKALNNKPKWN